jgi:serine/threonine protein kinase
MKKVDHPNCIKLHEVYDEKSKVYMVLDLVTGGELFDRCCPSLGFFEILIFFTSPPQNQCLTI